MDNYAEIIILIAGMWIGYLFNDMRRDIKEYKKDKHNKWGAIMQGYQCDMCGKFVPKPIDNREMFNIS